LIPLISHFSHIPSYHIFPNFTIIKIAYGLHKSWSPPLYHCPHWPTRLFSCSNIAGTSSLTSNQIRTSRVRIRGALSPFSHT
jgi:hypothetical protein